MGGRRDVLLRHTVRRPGPLVLLPTGHKVERGMVWRRSAAASIPTMATARKPVGGRLECHVSRRRDPYGKPARSGSRAGDERSDVGLSALRIPDRWPPRWQSHAYRAPADPHPGLARRGVTADAGATGPGGREAVGRAVNGSDVGIPTECSPGVWPRGGRRRAQPGSSPLVLWTPRAYAVVTESNGFRKFGIRKDSGRRRLWEVDMEAQPESGWQGIDREGSR